MDEVLALFYIQRSWV